MQIHIILYLLELSLPGPAPTPPAPLKLPKKRKRPVRPQPAVPLLTLKDSLEVFAVNVSVSCPHWLVGFVRYKGRARLDADMLPRRYRLSIRHNAVLPD